MYIEPNTYIKILQNVPIDSDYNHTLSFDSLSSQTNYFTSKAKYSLSKQSYQRATKGMMRVQQKVEDLYDCNYIMFQNAAFGTKWFYAFIDSVEYVNDVTSEIRFSIDVIQTWMFDFDFSPCYIEREHVDDDTVGLHTVSEGLETGSYITTNSTVTNYSNIKWCVLTTTNTLKDPDTQIEFVIESIYPPRQVCGNILPCYWFVTNSLSSIQAAIDDFDRCGRGDAIVGIFAYPSDLLNPVTQTQIVSSSINLASLTMPNNYVPKNNKCKTSPYCQLVINANGSSSIMRYEKFSSGPAANVYATFSQNPIIMAIPKNYEGQAEYKQATISLTGYPLMAWVNNSYQNWIAQNKASLDAAQANALATKTTADDIANVNWKMSTLGYALTGNAFGSINKTIQYEAQQLKNQTNYNNTIATLNAKVTDASVIPPTMSGSVACREVSAIAGKLSIDSYCRTCDEEHMKIIDDYFTMFGYAIHRVDTPNINSRRYWNYIKTQGCEIDGSIPQDDASLIKTIHDRGITYWHDPSNVGNYSLNNVIVNS